MSVLMACRGCGELVDELTEDELCDGCADDEWEHLCSQDPAGGDEPTGIE